MSRTSDEKLAYNHGAASVQRVQEYLPQDRRRGSDWPPVCLSAHPAGWSPWARRGARRSVHQRAATTAGDMLDYAEGRALLEMAKDFGSWQMLGLVPCPEFCVD
jgi:hypothetical protein